MATPPLTIRNLTPTPITLQHVSRFQDPNTQQSKPSAFSFASRNATSQAPAAPKLGEHAQTFSEEDIDIELLPFESYTLPSKGTTSPDSSHTASTRTTTIRLTIEGPSGERHRIDTNPSYTQKATRTLTPLTPTPSTTYSALYHPGKESAGSLAHLTLHTNHQHNLSNWMSTLPSHIPLSGLSIPGTHNSHTPYRALPSVRCQMVPVKTQLEHGIRFLDIRVQPVHPTDTSKKDLYLVHGAFPVALTGPKYLAPMLETCYTFLQDHPSETILISLKREGTGPATDEHLSRILETHYFAPNREKWYINTSDSNTIPYLGDVRGKLVLIRRYNHHALSPSPSPSPTPTPTSPAAAQPTIPGLPATSWPHNTPHSPSTPQFPFHLQDFCDIHAPSAISQKLSFSTDHLARANATISPIPGVNTDATNPVPPGALYLNFLSGSNFWSVGCWPGAIAKVVNRGVEEWVCRELGLEGCAAGAGSDGEGNPEVFDIEGGKHPEGIVRKAKMGDGSTGVVVMDHVGEGGDWDLVKLIVGFNMGILNKVGGS